MKNQISPTQQEKIMRDEDFIVSKTGNDGRITYANQTFIEFSGYSEQELLGTQHNIVRHPDMPRGVFKLLWDTLKGGGECFAYVKNLSRDGSFYWVLANVTPEIGDAGQTVGYFSVRRKPSPEAVNTIQELYRTMLEEERRAGPRDAMNASTTWLSRALADKETCYDEFILSL